MRTALDPGMVMERVLDNLAPGLTPEHRPELGPCAQWTGTVNDAGYAILWIAKRKLFVARWVYEHANGPLLPGLEPDHLCHDPDYCTPGPNCPHRRCVELAHLEAVTRRENTIRSGAPTGVNARKEWCTGQWGPHDLSIPGNVYVRPSRPEERECEPCRVARREENIRAQRAAARQAVKSAGGYGRQMSLIADD
ncbi:hypothetical protein [Nonomuraea dietziae]|uniref:hypothetical protein n=1 Tax=Nonomuraea dietziae TaxID=65515 RepID=UPI00340EF7A8